MAIASGVAHSAPVTDFLAGGTWHAVGSTWPGTAKFDTKKKEVILAPVGAPVMQVTYEVKLDKGAHPKANNLAGDIFLKNSQGQKIEARFEIKDKKNLTLTFKEGQRAETYLKMTEAEEEAERKKIEKLAAEGKLTNPKDVQQLKQPNFMDVPFNKNQP